jgi:hypothetical protein
MRRSRVGRVANRESECKSQMIVNHIGKKRIVMQSPGKRMLSVWLVVLGAAFAMVPARAQSVKSVSVDIPFDFEVGNNTLKAGSYRIEMGESAFVVVRSDEEGEHQFALTTPGSRLSSNNGQPRLVFLRYGSAAFLKEVVFPDEDAREFFPGKAEKELIAKRANGEQVALLTMPSR